ncbi:Hypothetical protein FKW44_023812 [Caligus rogercresseyi]|uniref:Uncharacterized protein n=1 Tax=Caligus rogercresseyi TaxID=217165 RepID=A0A7T8GPJ1_CALRO|nr:Hypothetical protein FKW44_023812 [Caligus rogercresseyi]
MENKRNKLPSWNAPIFLIDLFGSEPPFSQHIFQEHRTTPPPTPHTLKHIYH